MKQVRSTRELVRTALFAALVFLGIQSFRIPLPAAVGTPFLHFGHIFVVLAVLLLGSLRGTAASLVGLLSFDVLNGFLHAIPNVFVCTLLACGAAGSLFSALRRGEGENGQREQLAAAACAAVYAVLNIVLDFVWNTVQLVLMGSGWHAALAAELTAIPATAINAVFTVIGVCVLYQPARRIDRRGRK